MNNIAVSVVVAVYNREDLLKRCVDSLIYQTLEEIEIILVDDYSSDNSWSIMEEYQKLYPEKIRIMKSEDKGVAHAKNTGIKVAQGEYIAFLDSDDYYDYKILNQLYSSAKNNNFPEMVYSSVMTVDGFNMKKVATLAKHETIEDYLKGFLYYLHGKLFRADLFTRFGLLPILSIGEDSCFVFTVMSSLSSIVYNPNAGYYYERSNNSVTKDFISQSLVEDLLKGSDYILEHTNPAYQKWGIIFALLRICKHIKARPAYADVFRTYLSSHLELLDGIEDLHTLAPELYNVCEEIKTCCNEIPHTVYVNGFMGADEEVVQKASAVFRDNANVVVLNEDNCDLDAAPTLVLDAYGEGNMEFVGKYYALKSCYEYGGIFVDNAIEIDNPFSPLLYEPCFFAFESNESFSDKVFGSCPGNSCVEKILQTYNVENLYADKYESLSKRIKTVMVGGYNIRMMSCQLKEREYGISLYPADLFVGQLAGTDDYSFCHYREIGNIDADVISVSKEVLTAIIERRARIEVKKSNVDKIKKDFNFVSKKVKNLEKEIQKYKKNSDELLVKKTAALKKDVLFLKEKSENLQLERDFYKNKQETLGKDVIFLKDKALRMEQESVFYQNKSLGLEKDVLFLKNKSTRLEKDNEAYKDKTLELEKAKITLEHRSIDREKDLLFFKEKVARLEKENEYYKNKVEGYEKDVLFLKNKSAHLEKDSEEYKNKSTNLEKDNEEYKDKVEKYKNDTIFLKERTAQLEVVVNSLNDEVERLEKPLKEYERSKIARMGRKMKNAFSRTDRD